jgi:hypothetical protein
VFQHGNGIFQLQSGRIAVTGITKTGGFVKRRMRVGYTWMDGRTYGAGFFFNPRISPDQLGVHPVTNGSPAFIDAGKVPDFGRKLIKITSIHRSGTPSKFLVFLEPVPKLIDCALTRTILRQALAVFQAFSLTKPRISRLLSQNQSFGKASLYKK